jgi:hypothetical protein
MSYGQVLTDLITTSDGVSSAGVYGFKNKIINGSMQIDQRNAGASVTATTSNLYTVDRFQAVASQSSKYTVQQNAASVTPPVGFTNYLGVTSSSAYSVLTGDYFSIQQTVEGLNCADLAWGTANAANVTLSFWVRSSLTGTFGGVLKNNGGTRSYPFSYTITAANTWEKETITIAGDTSGTWLTTNGAGILVNFGLGSGATFSGTAGAWAAGNFVQPTGSTSVVGTNGATFYITGVQLEKGSTATSFDYRPYGTELSLCQRYLPSWSTGGTTASPFGIVRVASTTTANSHLPYPVTPRVVPTGITVPAATYWQIGGNTTTAVAFNSSSLAFLDVLSTVASGLTAGQASVLQSNNAAAYILATGCEL